MSLYKVKAYDKDINYTKEINNAVKAGNKSLAAQLEKERNAKIAGEGLNYAKTYNHIDLGNEIKAGIQAGADPNYIRELALERQKKAKSTPGLSQYAYDDIQEQAMRYYTGSMSQRPTYEGKRQTTVDDLWERVVNAPDFSYDMESDPVYKSYKDMYTREGQRAMQDTLAALSIDAGGENSWAVSAAAQAQNRYMQELADKVPELYNLAYDRYMTERNSDMNKLALARDMESTDYGRHLDEMNVYQTERGYYDTQLDEWKNEAQQYKTDAQEELANYIQAGKMPPQDVMLRAGITDPTYVKAFVEQMQAENELKSKEKQYDIMTIDAAIKKLTGQNYYGLTGPKGPSGNIIDEIRSKVSASTSEEEVVSYLGGLVESGTITKEEGESLYSQFVSNGPSSGAGKTWNDMVKSTQGWEVIDDGGVNGFWGIDRNAILKAPNGESIRLSNLVKKLIEEDENMTEADAEDLVKKLQQNMGV